MKTNPITLAARAKGPFALFQRARSIAGGYGFTSAKMDQALHFFTEVLRQFECDATFPITAVTLKRHHSAIANYLDLNIEFAMHGYTHINYGQLAPEAQLAHLHLAREIFTKAGITPSGFRSPYLSREPHLYEALEAAGFSYVSNQPFLWDALDKDILDPSTSAGYERALSFYDPWRESERLSLPRHEGQLVEIPVSLPDDEILIERLGGAKGLVRDTWLRILSQTYQRGELFTLQLHPERIAHCVEGLSAVLTEARGLTPAVWFARLDEIAAWWKARARATIDVSEADDGESQCIVSGPNGTTVLARAVEVYAPSLPWTNGYREVKATRFTFKSPLRPLIGVSPSTSIVLISFLRQQGYIVETSQERERYTYYIDQVDFDINQELSILAQIEGSSSPLLRLGRWPNGAQSALAITGDIDALTLWDYGLRMLGK
jgi:peptidoglycan/xylan/chitin deacetylase (PgdA/CDA1 family)